MKKIMVVDDEESMRELIRAIMETSGYAVTTAVDGNDCIEKLRKEKPDLVIMDMMMPGMTGKETVEKIRSNPNTKDVRVMFLTVTTFSDVRKDEIKKLIVSDYVLKPFDNEDLLKRVSQAIK